MEVIDGVIIVKSRDSDKTLSIPFSKGYGHRI